MAQIEPLQIARPYAKAAFDFAKAANDLEGWNNFLNWVAIAVQQPRFKAWIADPRADKAVVLKAVCDVCREVINDKQKNFLRVLFESNRVNYLPQIQDQYYQLYMAEQDILEVTITTCESISEKQEKNLLIALHNRFGKKIKPTFLQNPDLLGGAIIRAGDNVIDGSVKGSLRQLKQQLMVD